MTQGCSHVCPYWVDGYCVYAKEGSPCFLMEPIRKPDPAHFREWMRYRYEVAKFLSSVGQKQLTVRNQVEGSEPDARKKASCPVPSRPGALVHIQGTLCTFIASQGTGKTLFPPDESAIKAYRLGYIPTRLEFVQGLRAGDLALREDLEARNLERQVVLAQVLDFIEREELRLNGLR